MDEVLAGRGSELDQRAGTGVAAELNIYAQRARLGVARIGAGSHD